ncbi:MAG: PKD domain-containing protein [Bacteroidia bacterium]
MKSRLIIAFSALLLLCINVNAQAQITANPNTGYTGQNLTVSIVGTGTNFTTATTTYIFNGPNVIQPTSWTPLSPTCVQANFTIPPVFPTGPCDIRIEQANFQVFNGAFNIAPGIPPGNVGLVQGKIYNDLNANCVFNVGEPTHTYQVVTFQPGNYSAMTAADGTYSIWLPLGTYTAMFTPQSPQTVGCPAGGAQSVSLTVNGQTVTGQDFATNPLPFDVRSMAGGIPLRPGFNTTLNGWAHSVYGTIVPGVSFKLLKPSFATLNSALPGGYTVSGDTVIWPLGAFSTDQVFAINVYVPTNVPLGTHYTLRSEVKATTQDPNPANDVFTLNRQVVGSYDPNDKQVFTTSGAQADGDIPLSDSTLVYTVNFQNTGTDTAFNIYIRDTLDAANLNLGSFRFLGASHPHNVTCTPTGQMQVMFANIQLPDSGANEPLSHGWFTYQINRKAGTTLGTVIPNSAAIYFDFNAPVITNTVHTRYCDPVSAAFTSQSTGLTYQFTNQSTGPISSHFWDFGDGATSTQANPSHTFATNGSYTVCLISSGLCGSDTICEQTLALGLSNVLPGYELSLRPNPMKDRTTVWVGNPGVAGEYSLQLYDLRGALMQQVPGHFNETLELNRNGLAAGLYSFRVMADGVQIGSGRVVME